jgi:hypothetical protein
MRSLIMLLFLFLYGAAVAQYKVRGRFELGMAKGSAEYNVQVLGGVQLQKNNFSVGLSTGFDGYRLSSVPVMISAVNTFGKKKNLPFLFINAGYNIASVTDKQKFAHFDAVATPKYKNGYIGETGVGYSLKLKDERALNFSFGYSLKTLREQYDFVQWNGTQNVNETKTLRYTFRRAVVKCSINF